jgi:hypothetical protein
LSKKPSDLHPLLAQLTGGDFRSIGRSEDVAKTVLADPTLFAVLMSGLTSDDALIRMRAADASEKVTREYPEWLAPFKKFLLDEVAAIDQQEVRWHTAILFTRLALTPSERNRVVTILKSWLKDKSRIVQTFSLQALTDLSQGDSTLKPEVKRLLEEKIKNGPPSVQSRGKILLKELSK